MRIPRSPRATGAVLLLGSAFAFAAPAPVSRGLTFALAFDGKGRSVVSGPFVLRVPGARGALRVAFDSAGLVGGMLDAPVRLRNDSGADLFAVRVDLSSVTESVRGGEGANSTRAQDVAPAPPLSWDRIADGAETPADLFRGGPVALAPDTEVVVVLGVVSGLAELPADPRRDVPAPATKASACPGRPLGCRVDPEGNVWRIEPAAEGKRGGLSERSAGGAVVRSLWFERGEKPADLSLAPDGRLLVFFETGSKAGSVRAFRPF